MQNNNNIDTIFLNTGTATRTGTGQPV